MNFGERKMPTTKCKTQGKPTLADILIPTEPYHWGHVAREPDTNQHIRILEYKQTKENDYIALTNGIAEERLKDKFNDFFAKHTINRRFALEFNKRLNVKMEEYENAIDIRRDKLRDLLAEEEKEYIRETVLNQQKGDESRMDNVKAKTDMLRAKREEERKKIVEQKRLQQYMNRCVNMRDVLSKKYLIESKNCQLQQIRENQARRDSQKEMDRLWHDIEVKDYEAKREREEYEALLKHQRDKESKEVWDMQTLGKEKLREEQRRMVYEERIVLNRLGEELKKEKMEALLEKQRKKNKIEKELREQLDMQEKFMAQRKEEEDALNQTFATLAQLEIDREKANSQNTTAAAKREMAQYRENLAQIERDRIEEQKQLDAIVQEVQQDIQRKQDEARCKMEAAKRKLQKEVMQGQAEQRKYKQQIAEEQLKMQQADNELTRMAYDANIRLQEEMDRQACIARKQYQNDLWNQIKYKQRLQEREQEDLERQLALGMKEEERYLKMVKELCQTDMVGSKHPFRCQIEKTACSCPP